MEKKVIRCCRGHELRVPYGYFEQINIVGPIMANELKQIMGKYANWSGTFGQGKINPSAYYMCLDCFTELLMVMDKWRQGDPDLQKLIDKWRQHEADNE